MLENLYSYLLFQSVWDLLGGLQYNNVNRKSSNILALSTWPFYKATSKAYEILESGKSALDAVEGGCNYCELAQCHYSVGYGGHPDETGDTTLDAMLMNGNDQSMGAVGCLSNIKTAISVARSVMDNSKHSFLVGKAATKFGVEMGFKEESLRTDYSTDQYQRWKKGNCQPNFRKNVFPDPKTSCGPYNKTASQRDYIKGDIVRDTIGVIALDSDGMMAVGLSTNGADHKIPGRVGDSPIPGAGGFADSKVGAAVATGDGDIMMRFLPSYQAVEFLRIGQKPSDAAKNSVKRIISKVSNFYGAVLVADANGTHGAACHGWKDFTYTYRNIDTHKAEAVTIKCM